MAAGLWLVFAGANAADTLTGPLTAFMLRQYASPPTSLTVVLKTPAAQLPTCDNPQFMLPSRNRIWGNISVAVTCGARKRYAQVLVKVTGRYLVAARPIADDRLLTAQDIAWRTGRLDMMPSLPLMDVNAAIGSESVRAIGGGQPLTAAMLRRPWRVTIGQPVQVLAQGAGFAVQSAGKAMNNAAVNDDLRVRMESGQIVSGQLLPDGSIHVVL
ncbi:flagellar basal body P-ring formation protein FlgA [Martelella alba]|uniref:Flagella basal body P-ring formation protein FlgA n=2 Tax=Martelella alba TaxID=2590451 RepID=A0ABY2SRI5_9HYPH|nr:flagellar basal body P-ring formation protein FlgA [Martelella alba]